MKRHLVILILTISCSASVRAEDTVLGVWELVGISPVSLADSSPRGHTNVKEYYASDGTLSFIPPDESLSSQSLVVNYVIQGNRRTITTKEGRKYTATISFPRADELLVTQEGGDKWLYRRLSGEDSFNQELEPKSLQVLKIGDSTSNGPVIPDYDHSDYSSLVLNERIIGVWEIVQYRNVPRQAVPPYGFLNDVWTIDKETVSVLVRADPQNRQPAPVSYSLRGNDLVFKTTDKDAVFNISFDKWGRLVLDTGDGAMVLKLVSKRIDAPPQVPPRITLIQIRGED